ncbi:MULTISPECIES: carbohydrate-binding domain-containing protein [Aeromonas]|uniref:CBM10 domain-containing protein n=1 Tax=Aeromonas caviae TaxID=648 RepID=A0AA37CK34_AERCA|nr:carbohydrate-binding domain-containing protein [Aeromonas caviae]MBP4060449.1 cellulase family glycosylhydrolase [Aeromonas sp. Prich7-2]MDU7778518.1 carbohydrate-binding domain-containing protein [Aeromonas caviae]MDX7595312.1 carbohydrate-binding domain-containing protein [Aeromonas caviae]MDX7685639.1 carbohydrate-binding domain-containing protein [Aeromonas caviae]MDX7727649.1 carbohydrate-binding domain-containing protein [Aeromonas caviae]
MKRKTIIATLLLGCSTVPALLLSPSALAATTYPTCASAASDPDGDGWGWENGQSCQVVAGSGGGATTYPTCASAASDPDGDGWGWENGQSCQVASSTPTPGTGDMYVKDGQLYSASGQRFIARGINLQYGDNPGAAFAAITPIANTGANIVRLQLRKHTTAQELRGALDAIVARNMVAMPMYWESDVTCQSNPQPLQTAVDSLWLGSWKAVMQDPKYKGKILLNIANEWGEDTNNYADFITTYKGLIKGLRDGGYTMPLVIDAAHCGQYVQSFLSGRGSELLNADASKNLLFSLHAYHWLWDTPAEIDAAIAQMKVQNLAFLFGEFGDKRFQAPNNVDHYHLLGKAQSESVGWIAWSWKGNGAGEEEVLDMSYDYGSMDLSPRGNDIVFGEAGIRQTASALQ